MQDPLIRSLILGFTYGEDPRDFLRSATRANSYPFVMQLWHEYCLSQDADSRIKRKS